MTTDFGNTYQLIKKNANITNYFYYKGGFTKEEIDRVCSIVPPEKLYDGNVSGEIDKTYRSSRIYWIPKNDDTRWLYEKIMQFVKDANDKMWNFQITHLHEDLQFTEYDAENLGKYDYHMDMFMGNYIQSEPLTRKLSATLLLNDNFEGGEFEFYQQNLQPNMSAGSLIVFPSFLIHKVNPVTKGVRNSLVAWCVGPKFK